MKKKIFIFFIIATFLFSNDEYITANGKMSFKFDNKLNRITRFNGDMSTNKIDIKALGIGIYYNGTRYQLADYLVKKKFIKKTNIFETTSKMPFGIIKTTYIPSMVKKNSFYILNQIQSSINGDIELIYQLDNTTENMVIEYKKAKDYYKYNKDIYIKNLKNPMVGYIVPVGHFEAIKLKKIDEATVKYKDENFVLISKLRKNSILKSDIIEVSYKEPSNNQSFETSERLLSREVDFWNSWFKPLPEEVDEKTRLIIERFLVYLKTSTDGFNTYTNIGVLEESKNRDHTYMMMALLKYHYHDDVKYILETMMEKDDGEQRYNDYERLAYKEIEEVYLYLSYLKESGIPEFYYENSDWITKKINKIISSMKGDMKEDNFVKKGYEFEKYYKTYSILKLYRVLSDDSKYKEDEDLIEKYIVDKFILKDGIKKYAFDEEITYSNWEYLVFYNDLERDRSMNLLYRTTGFKTSAYFDHGEVIDIEKNLKILTGLYVNRMSRYGDINLAQLNKDIEENSMKIPAKIYIKDEKKYGIEGIDVYLVAKYLLTLYDRSN